MSETRRFTKNYVFMVLGYFMNFGIGAVTMLFIGWGLSVKDFGVFTYAVTITGLSSIIGQAGTGPYALAYVPRHRGEAASFLASSNGLRLYMALPMMLLLLGYNLASSASPMVIAAVMIIGVGAVVQLEVMFFRDFFRSVEMNPQGTMVLVFRGLCNVAGVIVWYVLFRGSLMSLVVVWMASQVPAMFVGGWAIRKHICPVGLDLRPQSSWDIVKVSYMFAIVNLLILAPGTIETIMLKIFIGADTAQIGYFQIGIRLMGLSAVLSTNIEETFKPVVSRKFGESPEAFRATVHRVHKFCFFSGVPAYIFTAVFAQDILWCLFGTKYLPAADLLRIICLGAIIRDMPPIYMIFHMTGLQRYGFRIGAVMLALQVAVGLMLFPKFGMWGAAWSVPIVNLASKIQTVVYYWRRRYPVIASVRPLIVSAVLAAGVTGLCWLLRCWLGGGWPGLVASGLTFLALVAAGHLVAVLDKDDRRVLREAMAGVMGKFRRVTGAAS